MNRSSGYEAIANEFLSLRGSSRSVGVGVPEVRSWARRLARGSSVIDLGCGPGFPITSTLVDEGLQVFAVDAAPTFVAAFKQNLPGAPIVCEAIQTSDFHGRCFDAALAWGLVFLLDPQGQRRLMQQLAQVLTPRGRLLFTAPAQAVSWIDNMTGRLSVSLGAEEYKRLLDAVGMAVEFEHEDEGGNHYYDAYKTE